MSAAARVRLLAATLFALGAFAIYQTWDRPNTPLDYSQSAFADLGPPPFIVGAGLVLALAALVRVALCGTGLRSSRSRS